MTADAITSSPSAAAPLLAVLQLHLPRAGRRDLEAAIRGVLPEVGDVEELVAFLRAHDDALTLSRSAVPAGFPALAHVLSRTVGSSIPAPHCMRCRKPSFFLTESFEGALICLWRKELVRPCADCGATGGAWRATTRGSLCPTCLHRMRHPPRPPRPSRPRRRPVVTCALCGKSRPSAVRWPLGVVCKPCYGKAMRS